MNLDLSNGYTKYMTKNYNSFFWINFGNSRSLIHNFFGYMGQPLIIRQQKRKLLFSNRVELVTFELKYLFSRLDSYFYKNDLSFKKIYFSNY